jgi:hypothetical protein
MPRFDPNKKAKVGWRMKAIDSGLAGALALFAVAALSFVVQRFLVFRR